MYDPFIPWPQSKIDAFNQTLSGFSDKQVLKLESEFRNLGTRESVILENSDRLQAGRDAILPSENSENFENTITLYVHLYSGSRPGLLAEIEKRGLNIT